MDDLTHLDDQGRAHMVDVGDKNVTRRTAVASARVLTRPDVIERIRGGGVSKGDVIAAARIAGIMAAKRTADLIPLCHPLRIDSVRVDIELKEAEVLILAAVQATDRTGVEMEAMTAASIAALTVYDMCKAVDRAMEVTSVRLEQKSGGKSGAFVRAGE